MPLTSAYAAGMRSRTKVYRGNVDVYMWLFDPDQGGLVNVGKVRSFEIGEPSLSQGSYQMNFNLGEDGIATAEKLSNCQFSIDGQMYKVLSRAEPIGKNKRVWRFRIEHSGNGNDQYD